MRKPFIAFFFIFCSHPALSQDIDSDGSCNANISGNGNNVTIECRPGEKGGNQDKIKLVITKDFNPIVYGQLQWNMIDPSMSDFTLNIEDDQVLYFSFDEKIDDEKIEIMRGENFYEMEASLFS